MIKFKKKKENPIIKYYTWFSKSVYVSNITLKGEIENTMSSLWKEFEIFLNAHPTYEIVTQNYIFAPFSKHDGTYTLSILLKYIDD